MVIQFTPKMRDDIAKALQRVGANKPCARCGGTRLDVLDGFVAPMLEKELDGNFNVGLPQIPCAAVVCANCGHVWTHALGVLGLLHKNDPNANNPT